MKCFVIIVKIRPCPLRLHRSRRGRSDRPPPATKVHTDPELLFPVQWSQPDQPVFCLESSIVSGGSESIWRLKTRATDFTTARHSSPRPGPLSHGHCWFPQRRILLEGAAAACLAEPIRAPRPHLMGFCRANG